MWEVSLASDACLRLSHVPPSCVQVESLFTALQNVTAAQKGKTCLFHLWEE